jgi:hypothetical protein
MISSNKSKDDLHHIRQMMEKSSRFISLSGLSGVSAGICALVGAYLAYPYIYENKEPFLNVATGISMAIDKKYAVILDTWLFWIAAGTFSAAFISAFIFTWIKSRKQGIAIWGTTAKRVIFNVSVSLIAGGLFLLSIINRGVPELVAPGCLIFYGLGLVNASKYTLAEIRYLGFFQILLGLANLFYIGYGLYFWSFGFGVLHIIYGLYMWNKYDRRNEEILPIETAEK